MYIPGEHWVICERCSFKVLSSHTKIEAHTGKRVCDDCFDPIPKKDINIADQQKIPGAKGRPTDVFLSPGDITADDL